MEPKNVIITYDCIMENYLPALIKNKRGLSCRITPLSEYERTLLEIKLTNSGLEVIEIRPNYIDVAAKY